MEEIPNVFDTLLRLGNTPLSGVHVQQPAYDRTIRRMQSAAEQGLGEAVPAGYVELLMVTNGVQINAAYFKPSADLVPENLDVPRADVIVLGNAGNVTEFVFDRRDRPFHIINMGFPNERFASFDTFAELLAVVMRGQGVV
jgi:hypothetical protein